MREWVSLGRKLDWKRASVEKRHTLTVSKKKRRNTIMIRRRTTLSAHDECGPASDQISRRQRSEFQWKLKRDARSGSDVYET